MFATTVIAFLDRPGRGSGSASATSSPTPSGTPWCACATRRSRSGFYRGGEAESPFSGTIHSFSSPTTLRGFVARTRYSCLGLEPDDPKPSDQSALPLAVQAQRCSKGQISSAMSCGRPRRSTASMTRCPSSAPGIRLLPAYRACIIRADPDWSTTPAEGRTSPPGRRPKP